MIAQADIFRALPDSPAGRRLRWYLEMLLSAGAGARSTDRENYTPEAVQRGRFGTTDEEEREIWRGFAARMGGIAEFSPRPISDFGIEASVTDDKGKRWRLNFTVEDQPPNRISQAQWERQFDFKVEVRPATEADAAVLAEIERRCPIELGERSIHFDRGDDYFAFARLMEEATVGIAFVDGVPAAVSCGAMHRVRIGGVVRPIMTVVHLRVLPEHQRKGLWGAVNRALDKYWSKVDGSCAFVSTENLGMQHGFANTPNKWSVEAFRIQLPCAELGGPAFGRCASRSDADAIVELLNATHGREEMYVPYTVESLAARLERAPKQYSWERVWISDRAAVGVWPAGESFKVVTESKGTRLESRRGLVLDYGFLPGAEREFESLLRAWCGWLSTRGMETLSIFSSPASSGVTLLRSLAHEVEAFNMWTPGIAEPPDARERGLYVDPIYF